MNFISLGQGERGREREGEREGGGRERGATVFLQHKSMYHELGEKNYFLAV